MDSPADKAALRAEMRAFLRSFPVAERAERSRRLCEWLAPRLAQGTILAFAPLPEEVDLWPLLSALASTGRLVLPRVAGSGLTFHRVADLDALRVGPLHLREPAPDALTERPDDIDVALVPGLAFGRDGSRLGRGKGLYDRALAGLRVDVPRIGVGFAEQILDRVPVEPHDMPVTELVPALR